MPVAADDTLRKLQNKSFNIMVTGTPGTGKTKLSSYLAKLLKKHHLDVSKESVENKLTVGYDKELQSHFIDEDLVNDHIDRCLQNPPDGSNGLIIDYHGVDFFDHPEVVTAVVVTTADTAVLKSRYIERGYNEDKIKNNIECELFRMLFEEAFEYIGDENKILEFPSNTEQHFESSIERLLDQLCQLLDK